MTLVTRFAPSPTGYLHLGHAYSALLAWSIAEKAGGEFKLRIEDIDEGRCTTDFAEAIEEDLRWLGVRWSGPVLHQSDHFGNYRLVIDQLENLGVVYPCFCTRKEIAEEIARAGGAPHGDGDAPVYPGTCRKLSREERDARAAAGHPCALRLDVSRAWALTSGDLRWNDRVAGETRAAPAGLGDIVVARKETPASYHLAVTVDDALQQVNLVVRGDDLFTSTHIHRLLQELLGFPVPEYLHHPLLTDLNGRRYSKRDRSVTLRALRAEGWTPERVREEVGI